MNMSKSVLAGAAIGLLAAAAFFAQGGRNAIIPAPVPATQSSLSTIAAPATSIPPPAVKAAAQSADGGSASVSAVMQADLMASRDWRAFALGAMRRPAEGGYFYARYAINLCGRDIAGLSQVAAKATREKVSASGTVDALQLKFAEELVSRCGAFTAGETSQLANDIRSRAADGLDPLMTAELQADAALKTTDASAIRAATSKLLAFDDSLLLSERELLARILASDSEARKVGGLWFDGRIASPQNGSDYPILIYALRLGVCIDGKPCGLDDQVRLTCLTGGGCVEDRRKYIAEQFTALGGSPQDANTILALADRVRSAVANRSVSSFVR